MHFPGHHQNFVRRDITAIPDWFRTPRFRKIRSARGEGIIRPSEIIS